MEYLIPLLIVAFILLVFVTLVGHGIWMALAWFFRELRGRKTETGLSIYSASEQAIHHCPNCDCVLEIQMKFCGVCGAQRGTLAQQEQLRELAVTLRQLERLHQIGAQDEVDFRALRIKIENERERIFFPHGRAGAGSGHHRVEPSRVDRARSPDARPRFREPAAGRH